MFFFFSSRRRHTILTCDWSSDVCSSDLQIHFIFSDTLPAMQHIRAGKLRALCITGPEPFALLPELAPCQAAAPGLVEIGRASCREREEIVVAGDSLEQDDEVH